MKAKIILMFVLLLGYAWVAAESIPVTNYSFEQPGTGKIKGWNNVGSDIPGWSSDTTAVDSGVESDWPGSTDGTWSGFLMAGDPSTWNLTDYVIRAGEVFTLQVDARDNWTNGGLADFQIILYYDAAGVRYTAASTTFTNISQTWTTYSLTFAADSVSASVGNKIGIELKNVDPAANSWMGIDNVRLSVQYVNVIAPADGAQNVPINTNLEWTVANGWTCDVYFGTQNDPNMTLNPKIVNNQTQTTYDPPVDLNNDQLYYWRVDAHEPNAPGSDIIHIGPTWSFRTAPVNAAISAVNPVFTAVDAGQAAVLTVTGVSVSSYQWYKMGSPDILLTNGSKYAGVTTNTLTISDVQSDDEGYYYCIGSNSLPSSASNRDTGPGRVMLKRLTSYYPFEEIKVVDGNSVTPDTVGGFDAVLLQEGTAGLPVLADVNQIDSSFGKYLLLDNADHATDPNGQYAQIPAGVVDYEDITITAWVHPKGGNEWQRIFDFGNDTASYMFLTPDAGGTPGLRFATRINNGSEQQLNAAWLPGGSWYFVALTITGNTGRLYRNGELVNTNTSMTINPIDIGAVLNYLGKSQYPADPEFNGLLDELKIYNYAKTSVEIAQEYIAVRGGWVCNNEGPASLTYDLDKNCRVDLADFALMAADWLESNRIYPIE